MSLEKMFNPQGQPEGRRIVYLMGKDGELQYKEFESRERCNMYLRRRHDSVVHYAEYLLTTPGDAEFIKEGDFKPRTEAWHQKDRARLRRKKKARRRERQRLAEEQRRQLEADRPTRW